MECANCSGGAAAPPTGGGKLDIVSLESPRRTVSLNKLSLNKIVLHVWSDGTCSLLTVPLNWRPGESLPANVPDERYDTPTNAMSALADAGRTQAPTMSWYRDPAKREPILPAETSADQS